MTENCNVFLLKLSHVNEEVLVSWCLRWAEKCLKTGKKKNILCRNILIQAQQNCIFFSDDIIHLSN